MTPEEIIKFAKSVGRLKRIPRTGWGMLGVKKPESVAEHTFRTAVLAMLLADMKGQRAEKLIRMALLHDLEEAVTGDVITSEKEQEKHGAIKRADKGIRNIVSVLPEAMRKKYIELWRESEHARTTEAKFLKQVDIIEMMMQALEYEQKEGVDLTEFWENHYPDVKDPLMKKIFAILSSQRPRR